MFDSQPVILDLLADGAVLWNTEVQDRVARHFELTAPESTWARPDEDINRSYFSNQTAFALQRLQSLYGYIVKPAPPHKRYAITTHGQQSWKDGALVADAEARGVRTDGTRPAPSTRRRRNRKPQRPLNGRYVEVEERARTDRDPFEFDPNELDRQTLAHVRLQNRVASLAKAAGYEVHRPTPDDPVKFDLAWTSAKGSTVVEIKTLSTTRGDAKQLRLGVGQVLDYQHRLYGVGVEVAAVLVVDRQPQQAHWLELCAKHGIRLVWPATLDNLFQ